MGYVGSTLFPGCNRGKWRCRKGFLEAKAVMPSLVVTSQPASWGMDMWNQGKHFARWWQLKYFHPQNWGRCPFWLIFFQRVETTNQFVWWVLQEHPHFLREAIEFSTPIWVPLGKKSQNPLQSPSLLSRGFLQLPVNGGICDRSLESIWVFP